METSTQNDAALQGPADTFAAAILSFTVPVRQNYSNSAADKCISPRMISIAHPGDGYRYEIQKQKANSCHLTLSKASISVRTAPLPRLV